MILFGFVLIPLAAGLAAWFVSRRNETFARWISLAAGGALFGIALRLWLQTAAPGAGSVGPGSWIAVFDRPWIPQFGIRLHLAADGLSVLLLMLTGLLCMVSVAVSWTEVRERVGFFHFNLLWTLAGVAGVFLSLDLFLFYFFWELMLVPMYFLIVLWGHENRRYAAVKFFLFTQVSGLLMLLAILGLAWIHRSAAGFLSFDLADLARTEAPAPAARWLLAGFLAAFCVKLPAVPFHTWLADAHTEAPTAGSVVLAGLLLKTGGYGLLRFALPLFPAAASEMAPFAMTAGVVGILYGAVLAFAQTDLKRLVAYTSVSHMGFVLLAAFSGTRPALQGAVMQMLCHGVSTGALFALVGALQERTHTRDARRMGGLWSVMPVFGGFALLFSLASLGLPGLGNFVAEFLVLLGTWSTSPAHAAFAAFGLVAAAVYALWFFQVTFHGPSRHGWKLPDLSGREILTAVGLAATIVWLGVHPRPVLRTAESALPAIEWRGAVPSRLPAPAESDRKAETPVQPSMTLSGRSAELSAPEGSDLAKGALP